MHNSKRMRVIAVSGVGLVALVGALFLGYATASHAAVPSNNPHVLSSTYLSSHQAHLKYKALGPQGAAKGEVGKVNHGHPFSDGIAGIDGVSSWDGTWNEFGYDPFGNPTNTWTYNMLGTPPQDGKTTTFDAPIVPVKLVLLDQNNNIAFTVDPMKDVQPTVNSPVFQDTKYSSSDTPTQFGDAVQRAEFSNVMKNSWHTLLALRVMPEVTLSVPSDAWFVALNPDGSVAFSLVDNATFNSLMFPATLAQQSTTVIGREELNGTMTTKNISTFLFDNTFLYEGTPDVCCVGGFHGPDIEPGDASNGNRLRNYDMIFTSWTSPGIFLGGDADITSLSHEVSETFNDPFSGVYFPFDTTPWWFSSDTSPVFGTFALCQDNLEVGDVAEVYVVTRDVVYPVTIGGYTYHPQTEALLQWFQGQSPSTAIDGAFSYPDESLLTGPGVSQKVSFDSQGNPTCLGPA